MFNDTTGENEISKIGNARHSCNNDKENKKYTMKLRPEEIGKIVLTATSGPHLDPGLNYKTIKCFFRQ